MKTNIKMKKYPKKFWIIPILSFLLSILFAIFLPDALFDKSVKILITAQEDMNDKVFHTKNLDGDLASRSLAFWVFYAISDNAFYFIFIGLIYNFCNVYKAFTLVLSVYISNLVCAIFGLICHQPRPYMVNYKIVPYIKVVDWGMPAPQIVTLIAFYCTFWKVISKHRPLKKNTCFKVFIGILFFIICFLVTMMHFVAGMMSIDQLLVSVFLGITVYSCMFFIFKAKINNAKEFYDIVKTKFIYYIVINLIVLIFMLLLYSNIDYKEDREYYSDNIDVQIERLKLSEALNNWYLGFKLSDSSLSSALCFISCLAAIVALKIELGITYEGDFEAWKKANFTPKNLVQNEKFSLFKEYSYTGSTQWNKTNACIVIIRLLIALVLGLAPEALLFIPKHKLPDVLKFILFSFLIYCYYSFGIFYLFKKIYRTLRLTNETFLPSSDELM